MVATGQNSGRCHYFGRRREYSVDFASETKHLSSAPPNAAADAPSSNSSEEVRQVKIKELRSSTTLARQLRSAAQCSCCVEHSGWAASMSSRTTTWMRKLYSRMLSDQYLTYQRMLTWDCETLVASAKAFHQVFGQVTTVVDGLTGLVDACKVGRELSKVDLESLSSATTLMSIEPHDLPHDVSILRGHYTYNHVLEKMQADDSGGSTVT